ncbi:MAG: DUF6542 domain-containing protein [Mycobacterium sp.]
MSAQRTRAAFAADQRSAHPGIAGVPPWAAVLIAVSATLAGFAFEAGSSHQELGFVFATFYALGCIAAVLAVRQSGIFTTVIQPPLLLFVAVPLSYYLFHGSAFAGLKDVLISCGYPLIERFPLMLFTSAAVLVIGMSRWYFSTGRDASPSGLAVDEDAPVAPAQPSLFAGLAARFAALTRPDPDAEPRHGARSARATGSRSTGRPPRPQRPERPERRPRPERAEPTRSRHARPVRDDEYRDDGFRDEEFRAAPRQRRQPARDADPRERPRRTRESTRRTPPPRERMREVREPRERTRDPREGYAPRPSRDSRFEQYPRESARDPYDYPADPPRRRPAPGDASGTHHPVSRVRYRGPADPEDRPRR